MNKNWLILSHSRTMGVNKKGLIEANLNFFISIGIVNDRIEVCLEYVRLGKKGTRKPVNGERERES